MSAAPPASPPAYAGPDALRVDSGHLIAIGDTQETAWVELFMEQNRHLRPLLLAEVARRAPDGVLHMGDLVTWGSSARHWARLDAELAPLHARGTPLLPVIGNHDRMWRARRAHQLLGARFPWLAPPAPEPVAPHITWYDFRYGPLAIVALDSNFGHLTAPTARAQDAWLDAALARHDADPSVGAILAYWHHPPWTNSRIVRPARLTRERFIRRLATSKKALAVLTGHCHAYEHFEDEGLTLLVTGGGGGARQPLETRPARRRREDLYPGGSKRFLHFLDLEVGPDALALEVVRLTDLRTFDVAARLRLPYRASDSSRLRDPSGRDAAGVGIVELHA